jgi:hypothetical protein
MNYDMNLNSDSEDEDYLPRIIEETAQTLNRTRLRNAPGTSTAGASAEPLSSRAK